MVSNLLVKEIMYGKTDVRKGNRCQEPAKIL